jgi:hypothetical protein
MLELNQSLAKKYGLLVSKSMDTNPKLHLPPFQDNHVEFILIHQTILMF